MRIEILAFLLPLIFSSSRIAIVGAGSGGSSVAFHLKNQTDFSVSIFEQSSVIGGRAKYLTLNTSLGLVGIELGASIFAASNKYIMELVQQEGLLLEESGSEFSDKQPSAGLWDGYKFRWVDDG